MLNFLRFHFYTLSKKNRENRLLTSFLSVCLPVRMEHSDSQRTGFHEISSWGTLLKFDVIPILSAAGKK